MPRGWLPSAVLTASVRRPDNRAVLQTVLMFVLRSLALLAVLIVVIGLGHGVGPLETGTLLVVAVLLVGWSVRVGRTAVR